MPSLRGQHLRTERGVGPTLGTVLRAIGLLALTGGPVHSSPESADPVEPTQSGVSVEIAVPEVGLVYVRYGPPGGVRILRGGRPELQATAALPDTSVAPAETRQVPPSREHRITDWAQALRTFAGGSDTLFSSPAGDSRALAAETLAPEPSGAGRVPIQIIPVPTRTPDEPSPTLEREAGESSRGLVVIPVPSDPASATKDPSEPEAPRVQAESVVLPPGNTVSQDPVQVREDLEAGRVVHTQAILFETNSSRLLTGSQPILDELARFLDSAPEVRISIEGHADKRGTEEYNQVLSEARAASVRDALAQRGVDPGQLSTIGYGESQPLDPRDTLEAYAFNRRVAFRVLEDESKPEGPGR